MSVYQLYKPGKTNVVISTVRIFFSSLLALIFCKNTIMITSLTDDFDQSAGEIQINLASHGLQLLFFQCLNAIYHSNMLAQGCCSSFPLPPIINPNSMNPSSNICFFCSVPLFFPLVWAAMGSYSVSQLPPLCSSQTFLTINGRSFTKIFVTACFCIHFRTLALILLTLFIYAGEEMSRIFFSG